MKRNLSLICITVFIDVVGYSMMFPALPRLISGLIHEDIGTAAGYGGISGGNGPILWVYLSEN